MSNGYNRVVLVGNVTREIEIKHLQSGSTLANVGLAVNERRKGADGKWVDEVTFVDVTAWGRTAEIASEYLRKGSQVMIEGKLRLESWQTKEGDKRSKLGVVCEKLIMLGNKPDDKPSTRREEPKDTASDDVPW